jgi:hypothetical protein
MIEPCLIHGRSPPSQTGRALVEGPVDSLKKTDVSDRSKINMHQPHELKYWTKKLGVSHDELQKTVDKVGNSAAAVRKELGLLGEEH